MEYGVRLCRMPRCGMMACMDGARLQPVLSYPPVIPPSSSPPPVWFWAETLFLPFIAPVSKGEQGQTSPETTHKVHDPQPAQKPTLLHLVFVYFGACCPAWSDLDTRS